MVLHTGTPGTPLRSRYVSCASPTPHGPPWRRPPPTAPGNTRSLWKLQSSPLPSTGLKAGWKCAGADVPGAPLDSWEMEAGDHSLGRLSGELPTITGRVPSGREGTPVAHRGRQLISAPVIGSPPCPLTSLDYWRPNLCSPSALGDNLISRLCAPKSLLTVCSWR